MFRLTGLVRPAVAPAVVDAATAQLQLHVFVVSGTRCVCGFAPTEGRTWAGHRAEVAIAVAADWLRTRPAAPPGVRAGVWAADQLAGGR